MQENSRYAVGLDIGSTTVRAVVGRIDPTTGALTIVGVGSSPNSGMRKGVVAHLSGPAQAIDKTLGQAEQMSGYQVDEATISINGQHILSTKADGMIAVGAADHEISRVDIDRLEDVATVGKIPANREILEVVPHEYRLDGQGGIKDPLGMVGTRLEISANVVSVLTPHFVNLQKTVELAKVAPHGITPAVLASARAVLTESQLENGVAVIDFGGTTTSVAVYEEGDLQYIGVIPIGGVNITNDLAIVLKTDPAVAERVKLTHANAISRDSDESVTIKAERESYTFSIREIDEIVEARLEELFESIQKELKKAGRAGKLPNGVVLTGGGANLRGLVQYAKNQLQLAASVGKPSGFGGVADSIETPQFATAVGLLLLDNEGATGSGPLASAEKKAAQAKGWLNKLFSRLRK